MKVRGDLIKSESLRLPISTRRFLGFHGKRFAVEGSPATPPTFTRITSHRVTSVTDGVEEARAGGWRRAPLALEPVAMVSRDVARSRAIHRALDRVRASCDVRSRLEADPVGAVHRYREPLDQELVALLASSVAFGNVKAIRAKLDDALGRIGPSPTRAADDEAALLESLEGWVHRVYRGEDIARLLLGARRVQRASGSLGRRFEAALAGGTTLRESLASWCDAIREAGGLPSPRTAPRRGPSVPSTSRRGPAHLLPDPRGASGSKRLLLFLRWMIRPADGIDLGLWDVDPAVLLCPVDTHIHKLARNLGFTRRQALTWETAEEITRALARFDQADPVKYDFSLCHLGMLQRCPSRRDVRRCEGCGVKSVCRHWPKS